MAGRYSWHKFYRLIEQLPWWSHYKLLLADDDELAEIAVQHGAGAGSSRPSLAQWDPNREVIAEIRDAATHIIAAIANSNRSKGSPAIKVKPTPRPMTAIERAHKHADYTAAQNIIKQVLPGKT